MASSWTHLVRPSAPFSGMSRPILLWNPAIFCLLALRTCRPHGDLHGVAAAAQQGANMGDLVLDTGQRLDQIQHALGRPTGGLLGHPPDLLHDLLGNKRRPAGPRSCPQSGQALSEIAAVPFHAPGPGAAQGERSLGPLHFVAFHQYDQHQPLDDVRILFFVVGGNQLLHG